MTDKTKEQKRTQEIQEDDAFLESFEGTDWAKIRKEGVFIQPKALRKRKASEEKTSSETQAHLSIKNPWDRYDFETMPTLTHQQAKTLRPVSQEEHALLSRGNPRISSSPQNINAVISEIVATRTPAEKTSHALNIAKGRNLISGKFRQVRGSKNR